MPPSSLRRALGAAMVLLLGTGCGDSGPPDVDAVAPEVSLTAPDPGAVAGVVEVTASASDNDVVAGVLFQADGADIGVEDTQTPYGITWNTTDLPQGLHVLSAVARDAAGNTATSAPVSVTVNNPNASGTLRIEVTTTGPGTEPESYPLAVDGVPHGTIARNGTTEIAAVAVGAHFVQIGSLGRFCAGNTAQTVLVAGDATTTAAVSIVCLVPSGQIVFGGMAPDEEFKIIRVNADGSDPVVLQGNARAPSWSHDRTRIVFTRFLDVYVMDANGAGVTPLPSTEFGNYNRWSPDDTQLMYYRARSSGVLDLFVTGPDGSGTHPVFDTEAQRLGGDWSPDGTKIVYSVGTGPISLWTANADGSDQVQLTSGGYDSGPSWSPDGSRIAYTHADTELGRPQIYVVGLDGTNPVNLTRNQSVNYASEWSPDGEWIAFTSTVGGLFSLWVMRADGTYAERLTHPSDFEYPEVPNWR